MKYQWLEKPLTCGDLSTLLGIHINSIVKGAIEVGQEDAVDDELNPIQIPVTQRGIEIDFDGEPTGEQIETLFKLLSNYQDICSRNTNPTPPLSPDIIRIREILATSPAVITLPEIWEILRIYAKILID